MSVPEPPVSLDNSCSTISGNTLFTYSPAGFLSLALQDGAEWQKLASGEVVTGAACVGTADGFFVVGGQSENPDYNGLQKFTYSTGEWTLIHTAASAIKNRRGHAAAYIPANNAIVVYAGTTDGTAAPSSQTFVIEASEPYTPESGDQFTEPPPALLSPLLLRWDGADIALVGGDPGNKRVFLFNPIAGWRNFDSTMVDGLGESASMKAVVVDGTDGSKHLLKFDMTATPNTVSRVVVANTAKGPVYNSPTISTRAINDKRSLTQRDMTMESWPDYNGTLASTASRSNYAMAVADTGMVVFSGGNSEVPLAMFDVNDNSWTNAASVLDSSQQRLDASSESISSEPATSTTTTSSGSVTSSVTSSITRTTSSATSFTTTFSTGTISSDTASATSALDTGAPLASNTDDDSSGLGTNAVLGIALGTILGFLALLVAVLLLVRRRKRGPTHSEDGGSGPSEKSHMVQTKIMPQKDWRGHRQLRSQDSTSSMAILMGNVSNGRKAEHVPTKQSSSDSMRNDFKSKIGKPVLQTAPGHNGDKGVAFATTVAEPRPRNGPITTEDGIRRSSGWNRYWSGGSALQLLGFGGNTQRNTVVSETSHYSDQPTTTSNTHSRNTQDSATVPPLLYEGRPGFNRVNTGSPVVAQTGGSVQYKEGLSGKIERPVSKASSGYSSGVPESVSDMWDPSDGDKGWGAKRADSYTPSFYWGTPLAPSGGSAGAPAAQSSRRLASGVSTQPQLSKAATSSDMSWLNLGDQRRQ
jgi:hypothetical protein